MKAWLWLADTAAAADAGWFEAARALLTASETARLRRIARPQRRAQFACGHLLLRHLIGTRAALPPAAVVIESTPAGVAVAAPSGWRASLAHSGNWVAALAAAVDAALGVDIEAMREARDIEAIAAAACGRRATSRTEAYLLWVQHEAEFKSAPARVPCYVGTWRGLALAACADTAPEVALLDLAHPQSPQPIRIDWTVRASLRDVVV